MTNHKKTIEEIMEHCESKIGLIKGDIEASRYDVGRFTAYDEILEIIKRNEGNEDDQ